MLPVSRVLLRSNRLDFRGCWGVFSSSKIDVPVRGTSFSNSGVRLVFRGCLRELELPDTSGSETATSFNFESQSGAGLCGGFCPTDSRDLGAGVGESLSIPTRTICRPNAI